MTEVQKSQRVPFYSLILSSYILPLILCTGFILIFIQVDTGPYLEEPKEVPSAPSPIESFSNEIIPSTSTTTTTTKPPITMETWNAMFAEYLETRYPVTKSNCVGQYISVTYNCPTAIGNRLIPVLNAFLIGVMFDAPIVFEWQEDGEVYWWGECELYQHHQTLE